MVVAVSKSIPIGRHLRLESYGNEKIGNLADLYARKPCATHADDRERVPIHDKLLVQNGRVETKASFPIPVTENDHRIRAGRRLIFRAEDTAHCRRNAEDGEIISGYKFAGGKFRRTLRSDADLGAETREQS